MKIFRSCQFLYQVLLCPMVNHMHNFRSIKKLLDLLAPTKICSLHKVWRELVNLTVFWLTWNFAYGWPMGIVGLGKKISKIKNLFYSAFFDLNKNQFRYVVNLLHKLQASRGGGSKMVKNSKTKFFHNHRAHTHLMKV